MTEMVGKFDDESFQLLEAESWCKWMWWQWCWWHRDVDNLELVMVWGCWWLNFDLGDILWILMPEAHVKRYRVRLYRFAWMTFCFALFYPGKVQINITRLCRGSWWPKWTKPSSTSCNYHQLISSQTSVSNIDVTKNLHHTSWWLYCSVKCPKLKL